MFSSLNAESKTIAPSNRFDKAQITLTRLLDQWGILLIFAISFFLRLHDLTRESLWLDEGYSVSLSHSGLLDIINGTAADVHPPLYYFLLHFWMKLFGDSETAVRMPSVLIGVLSVGMIYLVAKRLFDYQVGLLAALLLAISSFHVQYSQEARMYGLLTLLTLSSMYCLIELIENRSKISLISYVLFAALALYTQIYGMFVLGTQNLYVLSLFLFNRDRIKLKFWHWITIQVAIVVLYVPWIPYLIKQVTHVQQGFWIPSVNIWTLFGTLVGYAGSMRLFELFLIVGLFGLIWHRKTIAQAFRNIASPEIYRFYFLALWGTVPMLVPFVVSHYAPSIFSPKYTIPALAAWYILAAAAIMAIPWRNAKFIIVLLILFLCSQSLRQYYAVTTKEQWREATRHIEQNARPGDLIVFNDGMCQRYAFDYYSRREDLVKKRFDMSQVTGPDKEEAISNTIDGSRRVWLVLSHKNPAGDLMRDELLRTRRLSENGIWIGIEADLFDPR
jgi:mannosyltransferase